MEGHGTPETMIGLMLMALSFSMLNMGLVTAWSNGGFSDDPSNPDYGTHDWIAEHALDWLPTHEKQYILDNLDAYLYGTELPDNGAASDGIGDTSKHHVYFWSNGSLQDDAAAARASEEYARALSFLESRDFAAAAKTAGIMTHYVVDLAVFGHVMGARTDWGREMHHSDYETYLNRRTSSYDAEFNMFLSFDEDLQIISVYNAARELAYDTTFDTDGGFTCVWMDENYNWSNPDFKNRAGESLNLAVNYVTDLLHTLYVGLAQGAVDIAEPVADAGQNQTAIVGASVRFDAGGSSSEVGIVSYEWNFGDGSTGRGMTTTHEYRSQGTYTVVLTVRDAASNNDTDTVTITVLLDSDGDGTPDATDSDDDNDAMPDAWETQNELDPLDASDASLDPDGDGLTNLQEYQVGTDPKVPDAEALSTEAPSLWILGTAAAAMAVAAAITLLWRRRK